MIPRSTKIARAMPKWKLLVAGAAASISVLVPTSAFAANNPVTGVPESGANCRFNQYGDFQCTIVDSDSGCTFEYFGYYEEAGSDGPGGGSAIIC